MCGDFMAAVEPQFHERLCLSRGFQGLCKQLLPGETL